MRALLRRTRARIAIGTTATAIALAGAAVIPPTAAASYNGHAYLVVFNSRCYLGGSVIGIYGSTWGASGAGIWSGGDSGDNIIWPVVHVGERNQFIGYANCFSSRVGYYSVEIPVWYFWPTANNQTFYY
jgi:hypothetical protein